MTWSAVLVHTAVWVGLSWASSTGARTIAQFPPTETAALLGLVGERRFGDRISGTQDKSGASVVGGVVLRRQGMSFLGEEYSHASIARASRRDRGNHRSGTGWHIHHEGHEVGVHDT